MFINVSYAMYSLKITDLRNVISCTQVRISEPLKICTTIHGVTNQTAVAFIVIAFMSKVSHCVLYLL
jgi:hypothetical protein